MIERSKYTQATDVILSSTLSYDMIENGTVFKNTSYMLAIKIVTLAPHSRIDDRAAA